METRWLQPVQITTSQSGVQTVHGPFAALIFLMDDWPDMRKKRERFSSAPQGKPI
jgi:hypothetical protein